MTAARTPDVDPDLSPERFRELGYRTVDVLTDHFAGVREERVAPDADFETVAAAFDGPLPETGEIPILFSTPSSGTSSRTRRTTPRRGSSAT